MIWRKSHTRFSFYKNRVPNRQFPTSAGSSADPAVQRTQQFSRPSSSADPAVHWLSSRSHRSANYQIQEIITAGVFWHWGSPTGSQDSLNLLNFSAHDETCLVGYFSSHCSNNLDRFVSYKFENRVPFTKIHWNLASVWQYSIGHHGTSQRQVEGARQERDKWHKL